jgi:hypothetical protein
MIAPTFGYFEWKYQCNIDKGQIVVSLTQWNAKCFYYLETLDWDIADIQSDMSQAQQYIAWGTDKDYRAVILVDLQAQKEILTRSKAQLVVAIDDFESSLFVQIKRLLRYYLASQREWVLSNIQRSRTQLMQAKVAGNELWFRELISNMESLQYKLFLLDRIQYAHDFEELVPFLKEYLYGNPTEV